MSLSEHVNVVITQDSLGIARAGFGVPLILSANAAFAARSRVYTSLSGVVSDGFTAGSPEHRSATALFSQSPRPKRIRIGRAALKPTLRYSLTAVVTNSHVYSVDVTFANGTTETATYTSDSGATDGEIVVGIVAALNALTGAAAFTAAGSTSPFTVTAAAAGTWFALEWTLGEFAGAMNHADPGVATDLAAILLESSDWYALHTMYNSDAVVKAAGAWIEANERLYLFDVPDSTDATVAANGTNGTLDDIDALNYRRVFGAFHPRPAEMLSAGVYGAHLPGQPGASTVAYTQVAGATAAVLTDTQRGNLDARHASYYKAEGGVSFFWRGRSGTGQPLDLTRGIDWLDDRMTTRIFSTLVRATARQQKIPYTDAGVAIIVNDVRSALRDGIKVGLFASFTIEVPLVADVDPLDKADRLLPDIKWSAVAAGAVEVVDPITGVVSL